MNDSLDHTATRGADSCHERLARMFSPQSIALIGVTEKSPFSGSAMHVLQSYGMTDEAYLVNKRGVPQFGRPTLANLKEVGKPSISRT